MFMYNVYKTQVPNNYFKLQQHVLKYITKGMFKLRIKIMNKNKFTI